MILEVRPNGAKYWIVRSWINGKEKRRHLGSYPQISVKKARIKAVEARENISDAKEKSITFGELADEFLKKRMSDKKPSYLKTVKMRLRYIFSRNFKILR